jgi:hypothetical protein
MASKTSVCVTGSPVLQEYATVESVPHVPDDDLERYVMRTLPESDAERLEEHLLVCAECGDRLEAMDQFVTAMRAAAERIGQEKRLPGAMSEQALQFAATVAGIQRVVRSDSTSCFGQNGSVAKHEEAIGKIHIEEPSGRRATASPAGTKSSCGLDRFSGACAARTLRFDYWTVAEVVVDRNVKAVSISEYEDQPFVAASDFGSLGAAVPHKSLRAAL